MVSLSSGGDTPLFSLSKTQFEELVRHLVQEAVALSMAKLGRSTKLDDELLDVHEAADLLKCSVPSIERRRRSGDIPSIKIGRLRRYRRSDLIGLQDSQS